MMMQELTLQHFFFFSFLGRIVSRDGAPIKRVESVVLGAEAFEKGWSRIAHSTGICSTRKVPEDMYAYFHIPS